MTTQKKDSRAELLQLAIRLKRAASRSPTAQLTPRPVDQDAHLGEMQQHFRGGEDLLYPQEGDVVSDGYHHNSLLQPEADSLRRHLEKRGDTLVTGSTAASRWLAAGFVLASA